MNLEDITGPKCIRALNSKGEPGHFLFAGVEMPYTKRIAEGQILVEKAEGKNGALQFKSTYGFYLSAQRDEKQVKWDRERPYEWEWFTLRNAPMGGFSLETHFGTYLCLEDDGSVVQVKEPRSLLFVDPSQTEHFTSLDQITGIQFPAVKSVYCLP